jgi:putative ABC transport system permease protein
MNKLLQDVRFAIRQMKKSLGFTVVAVITLAFGIGANTAIFSVVNAVLLRPLPYKDDGRLVVILNHGRDPVAPANFIDWQKQSRSFASMGAAEYWTPNLTAADNAEKLLGLRITPEILPMLDVQPLLGRMFLPEERQIGKEHEVVLNYQLWQSHFAGDPNIIGRTLPLNGEPYTVVGVMPSDFKFAPFWATRSQLWAPLPLGPRMNDRDGSSLRVFARLNQGVSLQQAKSEMASITSALEHEFPGTNQDIQVLSLREKVVGNIRPALLLLLGAVGFVLLIACANVSHMLLARAAARQREVALRMALGARRWDTLRQLLVESLMLSLAGGAAGVLLATWGVRILLTLGPKEIPRLDTIGVDGHVLLFSLAASLLTGLIFGMAPAWASTGVHLTDALKKGERGSAEGPHRHGLRGVLVASEFALAVVLLAGAGLMVRTFFAVQHVDPGFDPHNVLSLVVGISGTEEGSGFHTANFYRQVLDRVAAVPGVEAVSGINHLPLAGDEWGLSFHIEGHALDHPGDAPVAVYRTVFPGYFQTMHIPVLGGRDIGNADTLNTPGVAVINSYMAGKYWPGEDPIGKRFTFGDPQKSPIWVTVVGMVKNTVQGQWISPLQEEVFVPFLQNPRYFQNPTPAYAYLTLVVRTNSNPATLASVVRSAIRSLDKHVPISDVQTMDAVVAEATAQSRFYLVLLGVFAVVALLLAAVGIYGVMSYSVSRRTQEIGIRMSLGAQKQDVLKLVVVHGMMQAISGVAVGLIGALLLTRFMQNLLYATQPTDLPTFVAVAVTLSCVAVIACYLPARRAAKVDPMVALRYE